MDLVPLVQCLLKARPSSWVGGFAQGLSGCILWVSRDGPTTSSLTHPQPCHWHRAQTVLTSRLLSSSPASVAGDAQLPCAAGAPMLALCTALSLSLVLGQCHWARVALRREPAVPRSLVTSSAQQ